MGISKTWFHVKPCMFWQKVGKNDECGFMYTEIKEDKSKLIYYCTECRKSYQYLYDSIIPDICSYCELK